MIKISNIFKIILPVFLAGSCTALNVKPVWKQLSGSGVLSIKTIRPLDPTINHYIIIRSTIIYYGTLSRCIIYTPKTSYLDSLAASCSSIDYTNDGTQGTSSCSYVTWDDDALYDITRHLNGFILLQCNWYEDAQAPGGWGCMIYASESTNLNNSLTNCQLTFEYYNYGDPVSFQTLFFHPTDGTIFYGLANSGLVAAHTQFCPGNISTWQLIKPCNSPNFFYIPQDSPDIMFLCAQDTLWRTSDAGTTWSVAALANINCMAHIPNSDVFIAGADSGLTGLYISKNNGGSFFRINNNPAIHWTPTRQRE